MRKVIRKKDFLLSIFLIVFSLFYIFQTYLLPKEKNILNASQTLPYMLGTTLLFTSIILMIQGFNEVQEKDGDQINKTMIINGLFYSIATLLYILVGIPAIGFIYSSLIYMVAVMVYYKEVSWKWIVLVPIGSLLGIYLVFTKLLLVRLP